MERILVRCRLKNEDFWISHLAPDYDSRASRALNPILLIVYQRMRGTAFQSELTLFVNMDDRLLHQLINRKKSPPAPLLEPQTIIVEPSQYCFIQFELIIIGASQLFHLLGWFSNGV